MPQVTCPISVTFFGSLKIFKSLCCPKTGVLTALESQQGANLMPNEAFYGGLGERAACMLRFAVMHQLSRAGSPHCDVKGDS